MNERDRLIELLSRYFAIGDSYAYNLTRVKEAFAVGTVTLDDFVEFDDEVVADITDHLIANNVTLPPVRAGQTVYIIRRPIDKPEWIDECVLENVTIEYTADGKTCRFKSHNFEATEKDISAWVFLTREEAERALEQGSECE